MPAPAVRDPRPYDVAIIGGGPAGAAAAGLLAPDGLRCVVLERARFPRPHVGESLVPAANRVLAELGLLETIEAAGFPRKYGAVWQAHGSPRLHAHDWQGLAVPGSASGSLPATTASLRFAERPQPGVDRPHTFHVDRARFDKILLDHARSVGAEVREETAVAGVELGGAHGPARLRLQGPGGPATLRAHIVLDCSGRATVLGRQLGLRVHDPVFDQLAVHSWFRGFDRGTDRADHIWVHFLPFRDAWIWQIPIDDDHTSIGVVAQRRDRRAHGGSAADFFAACLATTPALAARVAAAERVRPLRLEADYSYAMRALHGDDFLLVGDAARFVDPIFSSGVSIALTGASAAARAVRASRAQGRPPVAADFADYAAMMRRGTATWHRFISLYYRLNVLFTWFLSQPAHRLDVLALLQGDVYGPPPPVLDEMEAMVRAVEANPDHPLHRALGSLSSHAFGPACP